ncbi:SKP1-like protein 1A [Apium graveolens]|uniref:SKP1-like protein 1A n=1 Tax=Apium graveolens TaxID=4045 RepID=UPI003D79C2CF
MALTHVLLQSCDKLVFEVEKRAVLRSLLVAKELQLRQKSDDNDNAHIVLDKIDGETLKKVIEYCNRHNVAYSSLADEAVVNTLNAFDADFVNVDQTTFFALNEAAYYLRIKSLMDLTCGTLSKKFKGKNYKEMGEVIRNWKQNADQNISYGD